MHGTNDTGKSWRVGIENPFTGEVKGSIAVSNGAVATSGRYKRKWNLDGTEHHHLVNPFTGENENVIMSVTLVGSTCIDCDTFTKIIFHLPVLEGLKKIQENGME